jgi:hypothetical protein
MYSYSIDLQREIVIYTKEDGNMLSDDHHIHQEYISANQTHGSGVYIVSSEYAFA